MNPPLGHGWAGAVGAWSLVFAAPHFYWAAGGRAGLGAQAAAADVALAQAGFAVYNLAAGTLGILGAILAVGLARRWGSPGVRRWLLRLAVAAAVLLLVRGALGIALLLVAEVRGVREPSPPILLALEPWFVLGGLAYGLMAREERGAGTPTQTR